MIIRIKWWKKWKRIIFSFFLLTTTPTIVFFSSCANVKMFDILKYDPVKSKQLPNLNLHDEDAIVKKYLQHLAKDKQILLDDWQNTFKYHVSQAKSENTYKYEKFFIGINNFFVNEKANSINFTLNVKCVLTSLNNNDQVTITIDGKYHFNDVKFIVKTNENQSFEKLAIALSEYDWQINVSEYITKMTKSMTKSVHTNTCKFKIENAEKIENFIEFFSLISCLDKEQKMITKDEKGHYLLNLKSYYLAKQFINKDNI